jgi:hypothetical protein
LSALSFLETPCKPYSLLIGIFISGVTFVNHKSARCVRPEAIHNMTNKRVSCLVGLIWVRLCSSFDDTALDVCLAPNMRDFCAWKI